MRRRIGNTGKRTAVCAVSAVLLFSSMNLDILAADVNGLSDTTFYDITDGD